MYITLTQFKLDVDKYLKMALLNTIRVVDTESGKSWTISRGHDYAKPSWKEWISDLFRRPSLAT